MKEQIDIFDKMMSIKCFKPLYPFYKKNKEVLLYLFFGGLSFVVSITSYAFCETILDFNPLVANFISWILAVSFAYITNRIWVFESCKSGVKEIAKEGMLFFSGRISTLIVEEIFLFIGINLLALNSMKVKIVAQVIVIVLNYIISKLFVFNTK